MFEQVNKWQNKEEGGKSTGVLSRVKGFFNGSMEGCYGGSRALEEGVGSFMGGFYYDIDAFSFEPCTIAWSVSSGTEIQAFGFTRGAELNPAHPASSVSKCGRLSCPTEGQATIGAKKRAQWSVGTREWNRTCKIWSTKH